MSDVKLARTLARFQAKIDTGSYYEAHQTLRTITNRYVKSKQYTEAIDLLYQGASILASKKEYASAADLITYLIHTLEESGTICSDASSHGTKQKLIELINLLPNSESSLLDLAKQSINWSIKGSDSKFGDNDLHHTFGVKFIKGLTDDEGEKGIDADDVETRFKLFSNAELHLILGTHESLPYYVDFLYKWYKSDISKGVVDPGTYLSRAIINYSYLKNLKFIQESLGLFLGKLLHDISDEQYVVTETKDAVTSEKFYDFKDFEILNFLQLLVITLGKEDAGSKFLKLHGQYKSTLQKAEILAPVEYLGKLYFGLQLGNSGGGQNMLANLMGGLFK
ncbi:golgi to ER traffic protein 4 [[Candida] railenensis]|uniref:Golgi to ER traffic protein 4 n=1 Tax=[Candida] railenensis TaxID=45579 RepID=A0A9P0QKJ3_9ASCO|nr:golgi to ER traffic protein 4 [[Candida] railenensis]